MVIIAIVVIKMVYPELNLAASGRALRARLPIDGRLAARDGADRQGGLDGWKGMDKYLSIWCLPTVAGRPLPGGISKRTSKASWQRHVLTVQLQEFRTVENEVNTFALYIGKLCRLARHRLVLSPKF